MLHVYSSKELGHGSQLHVVLQSKLPTLRSSFKPRVFVGFSLQTQCVYSRKYYPIPCMLHTSEQSSDNQKQNPRRPRSYPGFKLQCHSKAVILPNRNSSINGRKKKYGGVLPSILRALESDGNIERILNSFCENLSPKEQTVVLKEQKSWERVVRVFEFFKSRKDYVHNVIHYNIVLRALGRAEKWDELRLCWIEMAKNGVLPTNNTYGMLVDVYGKAGLAKEALLWIKHMRVRGGLFPDEVTMNTVIKVLKDAREFNKADRFFKGWCVGRLELDDFELESFVEREPNSAPISLKHFLSTELFRTGGRSPIATSRSSMVLDASIRKPRLTSTYNTLIDLYGKAGRLKDAADIFAEMLKSGVAPDTITFNTMIFTCGSYGNLSEAESLLGKMDERGISPDTKTYNIFYSLYADAGDIEAALKYYRKIRDVGLFPDVVTHRAVLHTLCQRNMVQEVEAVILEMEKSGIHIDEHSVPPLMKMYLDERQLDKAKALLDKCHPDGGLSSKTLAAVLDIYAQKGLWAEAETEFYGKRKLVGKNDILEYNVMVKAYGKAKLYDQALSLFKGMKNQGIWPDQCTYNSIIQMLAGGDMVKEARELLSEMQAAGFKPQCLTVSSLIASYVRLSQVSDAVSVYQEMVRAGIKPNEVVYGSLINGFAETGRVEEAVQYFRLMEECGVPANQIVLTSLIKAYSKVGCLEGAKKLYEKMRDSEGGADIVASNSMLGLYADLGMVSEAKLIFDNLREKGTSDGISFATMIYLYKSMGMLDEAIDVAEEMKQSGFLRDSTSYNKVMACYATNGQLRESAELLHEMVTRKLLPDTGTFKVLFTILKKGGIPVEAVMQLESSYQEGKPYARQAIISSVFSVVGLHDFALASCDAFMKAEVAFDCFVYNSAIYAYGSSGQIEKALNVFMRMQDEGLEPDLVTHIYLVGCYGKAGMIEGIKRIDSQLKYGEINPNQSLFKAVIDAYRHANRQDLAQLVNQEMRFAFEPKQYSDSEEVEYEMDGSS